MKTKLVNRYFCDFCKKANCSAPAMTRHEKSCTNNPNRVCRMCKIAGLTQATMAALIAAVEEDVHPLANELAGMALGTINQRFDEYIEPIHLAAVADNCPACMLAGIRQSNSDHTYHIDFDFKSARDHFWEQLNRDNE